MRVYTPGFNCGFSMIRRTVVTPHIFFHPQLAAEKQGVVDFVRSESVPGNTFDWNDGRTSADAFQPRVIHQPLMEIDDKVPLLLQELR